MQGVGVGVGVVAAADDPENASNNQRVAATMKGRAELFDRENPTALGPRLRKTGIESSFIGGRGPSRPNSYYSNIVSLTVINRRSAIFRYLAHLVLGSKKGNRQRSYHSGGYVFSRGCRLFPRKYSKVKSNKVKEKNC